MSGPSIVHEDLIDPGHNVGDLYLDQARRELLASLTSTVWEGGKTVLVLGAPGAGKSRLLFHVAAQIGARQNGNARVLHAMLDGQLASTVVAIEAIISQGSGVAADAKTEARDAAAFVLFLDNADCLHDDTVCRLLERRGVFEKAYASFTLIAAATRHSNPEPSGKACRRLVDGADLVLHLQPFSPTDAVGFLQHCLDGAGGDDPPFFTPEAIDHLVYYCGGNPARIRDLSQAAIAIARETYSYPILPILIDEAVELHPADTPAGPQFNEPKADGIPTANMRRPPMETASSAASVSSPATVSQQPIRRQLRPRHLIATAVGLMLLVGGIGAALEFSGLAGPDIAELRRPVGNPPPEAASTRQPAAAPAAPEGRGQGEREIAAATPVELAEETAPGREARDPEIEQSAAVRRPARQSGMPEPVMEEQATLAEPATPPAETAKSAESRPGSAEPGATAAPAVDSPPSVRSPTSSGNASDRAAQPAVPRSPPATQSPLSNDPRSPPASFESAAGRQERETKQPTVTSDDAAGKPAANGLTVMPDSPGETSTGTEDRTPPNSTKPKSTATAVMSVETIDTAALVARGDALIELGDVASARLFFKLAARHGSGQAATLMGKTHDPLFLSTAGVIGIQPNALEAARWYRKATQLGDESGAERLMKLEQWLQRRAATGDVEAKNTIDLLR